MYKRVQKYRSAVAMTRGDTYKVDLPAAGFLSWLALEITVQQGAGAPFYTSVLSKWRPVDYLDNVIVRANGRADIVNVPGRISNYLAFCDQKATAYDVLREYSAAYNVSRQFVNFGRYAWDPLFGLDLSEFDNIELNLTNSWADTYWQGSPTVTVTLGFLEGAGAPARAKFFRKEIWRSYTTASDGREYLELPVGLPIRRVGFQADPLIVSSDGRSTCPITGTLQDIKMTMRSGAVTPYDEKLGDLMHRQYYIEGLHPFTWGANAHDADHGYESGIGDVRISAGISGSRDGSAASTVPTIKGDENMPAQNNETYDIEHPTQFLFGGAAYEHCVHYEFGDRFPDLPLLDPSKNGDGIVTLELHTASGSDYASGTVRVFLERLAAASDVG